jgi:hypothetical protein
MLNNALFLLSCIVIAALAWGAFYVFGKYTFLIMLVITISVLIARVRKAKFSNKNDLKGNSGKKIIMNYNNRGDVSRVPCTHPIAHTSRISL